jgi:hypothetical protein
MQSAERLPEIGCKKPGGRAWNWQLVARGQLTARTASCKLFELCGFRFKEASKSRRHWFAIHFRSIACVDRVA